MRPMCRCRTACKWWMGRTADARQCANRSCTAQTGSRSTPTGLTKCGTTACWTIIPTFTMDELRAIVDEAHRERHKVASHAMALNGVHNSVEAGVDSIEHGNYIADADLKTMATRGIYYVPTIFVGEYVAQGRAAEGAPV